MHPYSMGSHAFLSELGRRLRQARQSLELSVTKAAGAAGVSRRYWTETEAGRANPSIVVLARQAEAVGLDLAELVDIPGLLVPRNRIALVGLRGAGKSTVGRLLAQELEVPFVELDKRVEATAGLSLAEIFDLHGADVFRRYEAEVLEQVLSEADRMVIATGGSIVSSPDTFQRLRDTCSTVWLRAEPEDHFERVIAQGDRRPMADHPRAMEELRAILVRREPAYSLCDFEIDTSKEEPAEIAERIVSAVAPEFRSASQARREDDLA